MYHSIINCLEKNAYNYFTTDEAGVTEFLYDRECVILWINKKPYKYNNVIQVNVQKYLSVFGYNMRIVVICQEFVITEEYGEITDLVQLRSNMTIPLRKIKDFGVSVENGGS